MSAEKTDIETQAKRHRPSLWGMGAVVLIAGILLLAYLTALTTTDVDEVEEITTVPAGETD